MAAIRRREWLALGLAALAVVAAVGSTEWRRERGRLAFDRELAFLQARGAALTPQDVVAAALRLPRDRFLVKVVEKGLGEPGNARLLAATAVEYWDREARDDGLLPRPEHRAHPIRELLPLLPAIARAQHEGRPADCVVPDACLVSVWDEPTLRGCGARFPENLAYFGSLKGYRELVAAHESPMHHELLGVLLDKDPRPVNKDGFAGLVYGYANDEELLAAITTLCAATPR